MLFPPFINSGRRRFFCGTRPGIDATLRKQNRAPSRKANSAKQNSNCCDGRRGRSGGLHFPSPADWLWNSHSIVSLRIALKEIIAPKIGSAPQRSTGYNWAPKTVINLEVNMALGKQANTLTQARVHAALNQLSNPSGRG
jgi:hypothetical protein